CLELETEFLFQTRDEVIELIVGHGKGTGYFGKCRAFELVAQQIELLSDLGKQQDAVIFDKQPDKVGCLLGERLFDQLGEKADALVHFDARVGKRVAYVSVVSQPGQIRQQLAP